MVGFDGVAIQHAGGRACDRHQLAFRVGLDGLCFLGGFDAFKKRLDVDVHLMDFRNGLFDFAFQTTCLFMSLVEPESGIKFQVKADTNPSIYPDGSNIVDREIMPMGNGANPLGHVRFRRLARLGMYHHIGGRKELLDLRLYQTHDRPGVFERDVAVED